LENILFELKNVGKTYRVGDEDIVALKDINLTFEKGKVYCLLGTSGSGKSTLLNLLAGLEKPNKGGTISFMGNPLEKMNETKLALYRQRFVGFVFQSYNLLPTLTALENVTLPLIFRKVSKRKRVKAAKEMLKLVGLNHRWKHKPSELSGGQQQRVSIARAFVNDPQVVFADEPTGNLDTRTTYEMMDLITSMAREHNQTLIIVTHDTEIAVYADQIISIRDGNVASIETNANKIEKGSELYASTAESDKQEQKSEQEITTNNDTQKPQKEESNSEKQNQPQQDKSKHEGETNNNLVHGFDTYNHYDNSASGE